MHSQPFSDFFVHNFKNGTCKILFVILREFFVITKVILCTIKTHFNFFVERFILYVPRKPSLDAVGMGESVSYFREKDSVSLRVVSLCALAWGRGC